MGNHISAPAAISPPLETAATLMGKFGDEFSRALWHIWCINGRTKGFTFSQSAEQVVKDRFDENGVADNAVDIVKKLLSRFASERTKLRTNFFRRFNDKMTCLETIQADEDYAKEARSTFCLVFAHEVCLSGRTRHVFRRREHLARHVRRCVKFFVEDLPPPIPCSSSHASQREPPGRARRLHTVDRRRQSSIEPDKPNHPSIHHLAVHAKRMNIPVWKLRPSGGVALLG